MAADGEDEFQGWSLPDLVLEAVRIIRWDASNTNDRASVSMDNPFEEEVEGVRNAGYWDGYTGAIESILKPFLPVDEDWTEGGPFGPLKDSVKMLLVAKNKCSTATDRLRIEIASSLMEAMMPR